MKHRGLRSECPVHFALEVFGDSWTLLIVRDLLLGEGGTYTELLRAREGISTNILADRLARLEKNGIIVKDGAGARYELTTKGKDLLPILVEMVAWSAKHDPHTVVAPTFVRRLRAGGARESLLASMRKRWKERRASHG